MKREGKVLIDHKIAGIVRQDDEGYSFKYSKEYLDTSNPLPISLIMPLKEEPYISKSMLPFFDGLIPEGWLLNIAVKNWKLDRRDRMGLLLTLCKDCIGAVSIEPFDEKESI